MPPVLTIAAAASVAIWLYLLLGRGRFWRAATPLDGPAPARRLWPAVAAIIPARDEAATIAPVVASVLAQDYPGPFAVLLVDDHSTDGTAALAARAADVAGRLTVVAAAPLPAGWAGKVWALSEGVARAAAATPDARYLWFTDADIAHDPDTLRRLVAKAEAGDCDLVSLMVGLACRGFWDRLLIPPFVFFFRMLYPFAWVNDPRRGTAAAAGGCLLVRRDALDRAGGLAAIRGALIDDCALAARIAGDGRDGGGRLWLGLTDRSRSIRPYAGLAGIWRMVARSAYTQLNRSPLLLGGTLVGMALTYLAPPLAVLAYPLHGAVSAAVAGLVAWTLMAAAIAPTLRLYHQPAALGLALPAAALLYCAMTVDSALRHATGRGGRWKGRVQAAGKPSPGPGVLG